MGFLSTINQPKVGGTSLSLMGTDTLVMDTIVSRKIQKTTPIGIPQYPNRDTTVSLLKGLKPSNHAA
jgi:hypothetical protein